MGCGVQASVADENRTTGQQRTESRSTREYAERGRPKEEREGETKVRGGRAAMTPAPLLVPVCGVSETLLSLLFRSLRR